LPEIKAKLTSKLEEFSGLTVVNEDLLRKKGKLERQQ